MAQRLVSWDALPEELIPLIGARLRTLRCYIAARGVCRTWRTELPPLALSLCLFLVGRGGTSAAHSLPLRRRFGLPERHDRYRYIGSSGGWLAVAYESGSRHGGDMSDEPKPKPKEGRREDTELAASSKKKEPAPKVYYYTNFGGTRVRMQNNEVPEIRYPDEDKWRMSLLNPVTGKHIVLPEDVKLEPDHVTMVAFAPNPSVRDYTAVAAFGTGGLAYMSTRDGGGWSFGEITSAGEDPVVIMDMVYCEGPPGRGGDRVYCLTRRGDVHVLHVPRGRPERPAVEPLLPELVPGYQFVPAYVFPQPHATLSDRPGARNLAFIDGNLYQVWRNTVGKCGVKLPDGGGLVTVPNGEVFVLRFHPKLRPCWVEETDLRGYALFVGPANNTMAVLAESMPGVKPNCVYWVDRPLLAMVFDLKTRQSTPCIAPSPSDGCNRPVCWLSLGNKIEQLRD